MKTPRELLLDRHRTQMAALDEIRARVVTRQSGAGLRAVANRTQTVSPAGSKVTISKGVLVSVDGGTPHPAAAHAVPTLSAPARDRRDACPALGVILRQWLTFNRVAWSALAAVWCVIIGLSIAASVTERPATTVAATGMASGEVLADLRGYRAQLAQLLSETAGDGEEAASPDPVIRPRSDADRPRKGAAYFQTAFA